MFRPNDQLGPFRLIEKIGRGTFGEVWLAEEKTSISSHRVALKLPNEEDVDLEAIRQEAHVWEEVKGHPNILPIIRADVVDGQIYIASEYAPDGSLSKWLRRSGGKAPTPAIARRMILGILAGLEHLHSKGIVHRDLKPENILLQAETPRIADFGIARLIQSTSNSTTATGTPAYMAPECFIGTRSEKSDLWAAGVIFHVLLSGRLPFPQPDQVSVMNAIVNGQPEIAPTIDSEVHEVIRTALAHNPADRFDSVWAMSRAVEDPEAVGARQSFGDHGFTVDLQPDDELETVVLTRDSNKLSTKGTNWWKVGVGALGFIIVSTVGMFMLTRVAPVETALPNANANNALSNQPVGESSAPLASEAGENLPTFESNVQAPAKTSNQVPGGESNEYWADGYYPPPVERPPAGVTVTVPTSRGSEFMSDIWYDKTNNRCFNLNGAVPCPPGVQRSDRPPAANSRTTPDANFNFNTATSPPKAANAAKPANAPAAKPLATPPPRTRPTANK